MSLLEIRNLKVSIIDDDEKEKEILKGVDMKLEKGKIYALMGPNGSGKTSLSNAITGNPKYKINSGDVSFEGENIMELKADERARRGIFMSFQYPKEIQGVALSSFLRQAYNSIHPSAKKSVLEFHEFLKEKANLLDMNEDFLDRYLNQGFSGGEKKKSEILQMLALNPKLAILDETDSGLDIDALRTVARGVREFADEENCVLIITHYKRILDYIKPDRVLVMLDGRITLEEGSDFVNHIEEKGYGWLKPKPISQPSDTDNSGKLTQ